MIKKFLGLISFMLVASLGYGESMDFVTVLSSPVGSFANLETANASFPATANKVNFGSRLASGGTISLAGTTGPSLGKVVLDKNAGLSSTNAKEVRVPGVKVSHSGALKGASLLAGTFNMSGAELSELQVKGATTTTDGQVLIDSGITVQAAGANKLTINRTGSKTDNFNSATNSRDVMWSNIYATDYDGSQAGTRDYSRQYILKGKPVRIIRPYGIGINGFTGAGVHIQPVPAGQCGQEKLVIDNIGSFGSGIEKCDAGGPGSGGSGKF